MRNSELDSAVLMLLCLLFMMVIASRSLRRRLRPRPVRRVSISLQRLRRLAYRRRVCSRLLFVPPAIAFVGICHSTGRMNLAASLVALLVLLIYPLLDALIILHLQLPPFRTLAKGFLPAFEKELAGRKELIYAAGAWGYQDGNWYICVGPDVCALLYGPDIDFSSPVQRRTQSWTGGPKAGTLRIHHTELHFTSRDGKPIIARTEISPALQAWIRDHRGRI